MSNPIERPLYSYDEFPYVAPPTPATWPDNLNAVGRLAGLIPAAISNCRVLEIGCGVGNNLISMARSLPGSKFVGFDLSEKQVGQARANVNALALKNVEIKCENLLNFVDESSFDYIICHGVYSWVPEEVRDRILQVCRTYLSPSGLAYVSYNTLPGWHLRRLTRDMMLYHARNAGSAAERLASGKQILSIMSGAISGNSGVYASVIRELAPKLATSQDWYLIHDDLGDICHPVYFHQFIEHAHSHGLRYVGGAEPGMNRAVDISPYWRDKLHDRYENDLELEQLADFVSGTQYRSSVICRADAETAGSAQAQQHVKPISFFADPA